MKETYTSLGEEKKKIIIRHKRNRRLVKIEQAVTEVENGLLRSRAAVQTEQIKDDPLTKLMGERSEQDVKWLKVPNVVAPYDKVALLGDDIYFQLEVFGLTKADLISWFVETETGLAFVTATGKIFISAGTAISMLEASNHPDTERFSNLVSKIHEQAIKIYYPNQEITNAEEK
jgi:hypothetical protein